MAMRPIVLVAILVVVGICGTHANPNKEQIQQIHTKVAAKLKEVRARATESNISPSPASEETWKRWNLAGHGGHDNEMDKVDVLSEPMERALYTTESDGPVNAFYSAWGIEGIDCAFAKEDLCEDPTALDFGIKYMCPVSCNLPQEEFCNEDNDMMMYEYVSMYYLAMPFEQFDSYFASGCANAVATIGQSMETLVYPNGDAYGFCEEPYLALACSKSCETNCWTWPPPPQTKVFVPGCQQTMMFPSELQTHMRNTYRAGASVCPPTPSGGGRPA